MTAVLLSLPAVVIKIWSLYVSIQRTLKLIFNYGLLLCLDLHSNICGVRNVMSTAKLCAWHSNNLYCPMVAFSAGV